MRQYEIKKATKEDLWEILDLQYIAYQSEADLFGTQDIPPLKQTIDEVIEEYFLFATFGNEYLQYKKKVCRYIGRKR